jgi:hypothetical protein
VRAENLLDQLAYTVWNASGRSLKWCREEDSKLPGGEWQSGYAVREGVDAGSIPRSASA